MRRSSLIVAGILALLLAAAAAACGGGLSGLQTPEDMLVKIVDASEDISSLEGTFEAEIQMSLDPAQVPEEDQAMLAMFGGPITATGTIAYSNDRQVADIDVTLAMAGFSYNMGLKVVEEQAWLRMFGQWYDFAPALQETGSDLSLWEDQYDPKAIEDKLAEMGIDPLSWLGDASLEGEETLLGIDTLHLTCTPDVTALFDDVLLLLQDPEFMNLLDPSGALLESLGQDLPSVADLKDIRAELIAMFQELTVDLWAAKSDASIRQMIVYANIVPPAEAEMVGVESIGITATMALESLNRPVKVDAPDSSLPYSALEDLMGGDSGLAPFTDSGASGGVFDN